MEGAGAKAAAEAIRQDAIAIFMIDNMLFVFGEIEKYEMNGFAPHFWMCNPLDILQDENLLALSKAQDWHVDSPPMDQISLQRWCQMKVFYPSGCTSN